jgi:hypothetical protein
MIFLGGSPYLLRIGGVSEAGHHRSVRATKGHNAWIAHEVQVVARWQYDGVEVWHSLFVPCCSLYLVASSLFDAWRIARDKLLNFREDLF